MAGGQPGAGSGALGAVADRVRARADIVDVVSEFVALRPAGKSYKGLCPFHAEKTPSFTVSPDRQLFYCFGCGAGGNVFTFLMKLQGLSFVDAVRRVAERVGMGADVES
ncbi:MAG: CHC2 zinc finger domain-containing protein, partial [Bacillota bacterium]